MRITQDRYSKYDTIRFLLMFLVIVGHEMELFLGGKIEYLYTIIYSFHMPAFLFLTGKFAKFEKMRVLKHLCFPYVVFQILYLCFAATVLSNGTIQLQFTTPYWILWYLLAVIFCYALIPFLPGKDSPRGMVVVVICFVLSVLVGYETTIGYYLTLSRFFVFLPFFLCGYYQDNIVQRLKKWIPLKPAVWALLSLIILLLGEAFILRTHVPAALLYGSYSYAACGCSAIVRILAQATALGWIVLLCSVIPNISLPVISTLGRNTMPVFILHGFVILYLGKIGLFHFTQKVNLVLACMIAAVLYLCLGNRYVAKGFKKVF